MKLVTFQTGAGERVGAMVPAGILDLAAAGERLGHPLPVTMQALIDAGEAAWDLARSVIAHCPDEAIVAEPRLRTPLPRPLRLRDACLFLEHLEASFKVANLPFSAEFHRQIIYYNADNLHVFGSGEDVPWPRASSDRDYELEWACVIGKPGANIALEAATGHIFGYTIFNDWSARDLQMPFMTGYLGPAGGKDFANSLGPCIVTPDEFDDPYALRMTARVNGETWSDGNTTTMHHRFEDAIARLSEDRILFAGEIIGSGTVLTGCGFETGRQLALGDVVELEVEGIGVLRNRIVAA
jgi:2-keto-4-pentenoate hydratase/2-oxohepta-3-ene-1,7-dioic acid hydratase in catechol pathway